MVSSEPRTCHCHDVPGVGRHQVPADAVRPQCAQKKARTAIASWRFIRRSLSRAPSERAAVIALVYSVEIMSIPEPCITLQYILLAFMTLTVPGTLFSLLVVLQRNGLRRRLQRRFGQAGHRRPRDLWRCRGRGPLDAWRNDSAGAAGWRGCQLFSEGVGWLGSRPPQATRRRAIMLEQEALKGAIRCDVSRTSS